MALKSRASIAALSLLASFALATDAEAAFNMRKMRLDLPHPASQMQDGKPQLAPIAYVIFCLKNTDQCEKGKDHDRVDLDADTWALLQTVNGEVNARIAPDPAKGTLDWSVSATVGNCNDYAVQKRKALIEKGLSPSALSLSVVITPWGEGHLVLTVRTDRGDYVLDNLRPSILAWDRTGYRFNSVQSAGDPEVWVEPGRGYLTHPRPDRVEGKSHDEQSASL